MNSILPPDQEEPVFHLEIKPCGDAVIIIKRECWAAIPRPSAFLLFGALVVIVMLVSVLCLLIRYRF